MNRRSVSKRGEACIKRCGGEVCAEVEVSVWVASEGAQSAGDQQQSVGGLTRVWEGRCTLSL